MRLYCGIATGEYIAGEDNAYCMYSVYNNNWYGEKEKGKGE